MISYEYVKEDRVAVFLGEGFGKRGKRVGSGSP